jgi:hypothetical protein
LVKEGNTCLEEFKKGKKLVRGLVSLIVAQNTRFVNTSKAEGLPETFKKTESFENS